MLGKLSQGIEDDQDVILIIRKVKLCQEFLQDSMTFHFFHHIFGQKKMLSNYNI